MLRVLKTPSSLNGAEAVDGLTGGIASPEERCPSTTGHRFGAATYQGAGPCPLAWLACSQRRQRRAWTPRAASSRETGCDGAQHRLSRSLSLQILPHGSCNPCELSRVHPHSGEENHHISCRQRISTPEALDRLFDPTAFLWLFSALLHL